MTRRVHLQLSAITSDDGTRCAAECPHLSSSWCECTSFRAVVMRHEGGYLRAAACIAAEQAAASPLVCTCATMARDPQAPGYQMCPRCTIAHDAIVDEWTRIGSLEDAVMREIAAVGGPVVRDVGGPINVAASVAATIARLGEQAAASVPSCEGIADDIERLERHIHKNGDRLGDDIVESIERIISVVVTSPPVDAPHFDGGARALDASEALREARVQGMREGFRIVELRADQPGEHGYESDPGVAWEDASMDLDAAIEAVRKGER